MIFVCAVAIPEEFFTAESMLTLTGATGATFVVANGIQRAFNWNPRYLALVIAEAICLLGVAYLRGGPVDYVVGLINGFLVFCTAAGGTGALGAAAAGAGQVVHSPEAVRDAGPDRESTTGRRSFVTPWF